MTTDLLEREAEIEARIGEGVTWLDQHSPDWLAKVDLERLYMASYDDCVVGQVFGDLDKAPGFDPHAPRHQDLERMLFIIPTEEYRTPWSEPDPSLLSYDDLQVRWAARILRLRSERAG